MASDQSMVDFILEQLADVGHIHAKKMFGEYGLYADDKIFALVCDNMLYIKPTQVGRDFLADKLIEAPPYQGAKPYFLIEDIDDKDTLCELVNLSVTQLPLPKPKKVKKINNKNS